MTVFDGTDGGVADGGKITWGGANDISAVLFSIILY